MKILIISDGIFPFSMGGSHRSIFELASELTKMNHSVTCLIPETHHNQKMSIDGDDEIDKINFEVIKIKTYKSIFLRIISFFWVYKKVYSKIYNEFDLINIHFLPALFGASSIINKDKLIYSFHGPWSEELKETLFGKLNFSNKILKFIFQKNLLYVISIILKKIEINALKNSNNFIINSNYMKNKLEVLLKNKNSQIFKIYHGINNQKFYPNQKKIIDNNDKFKLLTIRRLESRMGLSELISAIQIIKESSKVNIELTIGGQGNEYFNLKKLIKKLNCDEQVKLLGYIPENKIRNIISSADLFILPSRKLEGFGLVILESMACGTPVLVSPFGGQKEIIEKFDKTLILENINPNTIAAKILDIIESKKINSKFQKDIISFVNVNFSWKKHANEYEKIFLNYV